VEQPVARAKSRARERSTALAYTGRRSDIATSTAERENILAGKQRQKNRLHAVIYVPSESNHRFWKGDTCGGETWHCAHVLRLLDVPRGFSGIRMLVANVPRADRAHEVCVKVPEA
jgi:hypothetical protein